MTLLRDNMNSGERRAAVLEVLRRFHGTGPFDPELDMALEWTIKVLSEISADGDDRRCFVCGQECQEHYALKDEIWRAVMPSRRGFLHLGCLESAIGRPLSADDFKEAAPVNAALLFVMRRQFS